MLSLGEAVYKSARNWFDIAETSYKPEKRNHSDLSGLARLLHEKKNTWVSEQGRGRVPTLGDLKIVGGAYKDERSIFGTFMINTNTPGILKLRDSGQKKIFFLSVIFLKYNQCSSYPLTN